MVIGALRIELYLPGCTSLKAKRKIVKSIVERTKAKFDVAVSEVGHQALWQRSLIAIAYTSETQHHTDKVLSNVLSFIEHLNKATIIAEDKFFMQPD